MTTEEPDWEDLGDDWGNRFTDIVTSTSLEREAMLEILNEPWTVEEYMDAVSNLGSPGNYYFDGRLVEKRKKGSIAGWKRMELVNSLVIEFLKTGTISSDWY